MSDVDRPVLNSISLFSGVGMLDVGIASGLEYLGCGHRTVAYVEREAFACSQLVALMQAGCLGEAPVWSDVTTFPAGKFRGLVDIIVGGFPCQDISIAGRRAGLDGNRSGLFFTILDIADACDAPVLFLENVSAIATANATVMDEAEGELIERAAARVMGELADRGWDAEWLHLRASDVGASHQRERWFCLAIRRDRLDDSLHGRYGNANEEIRAGRHGAFDASNDELADAGSGLVALKRRRPEGRDGSGSGSAELAHPSSPRPQGREQPGTRISHRGGAQTHGPVEQLCGLFAPGPSDPRWAGIIERFPYLAPATQPGVCCVADGITTAVDESRRHQLRAIGNGCVPSQAAAAFVYLVRRFGHE